MDIQFKTSHGFSMPSNNRKMHKYIYSRGTTSSSCFSLSQCTSTRTKFTLGIFTLKGLTPVPYLTKQTVLPASPVWSAGTSRDTQKGALLAQCLQQLEQLIPSSSSNQADLGNALLSKGWIHSKQFPLHSHTRQGCEVLPLTTFNKADVCFLLSNGWLSVIHHSLYCASPLALPTSCQASTSPLIIDGPLLGIYKALTGTCQWTLHSSLC